MTASRACPRFLCHPSLALQAAAVTLLAMAGAAACVPFWGPWIGGTDCLPLSIHAAAARHSLLAYGQLPGWNPWSAGGISLAGDLQAGFLAPTFLLRLVFGAGAGQLAEYVLMTGVAAGGAFILCRHHGADAAPSLLPAAAFAFSNALPVYLFNGWFIFLHVALLPWGLWAFDAANLARGRPARRLEGLLGLLLAVMFLRGSLYPLSYLVMALALLTVIDLLRRRSLRPVRTLATAGAVSLLLAAPKLLAVASSMDSFESRAGQEGFSVNSIGLVNALARWSDIWESVGYVGPMVLVLGLGGFMVGLRRLWPLMICAAFFSVYALGTYIQPGLLLNLELGEVSPTVAFQSATPARDFPHGASLSDLVQRLPLLSFLTHVSRAIVLVGLIVAVASGVGLHSLCRRLARVAPGWRGHPLVPWAVVLVALAVVGVTSWLPGARLLATIKPLVPPGAGRPRPFQQQRQMSAPDGFAPLLNIGHLNVSLPFHQRSPHVRGVGEEGYRGEHYWEGEGNVELVEWSPNRLRYALTGVTTGRLVINQNHKPGWSARGGELEGHNGLMSVRNVTGQEVVLTYRPPMWAAGLVSLLLGLVLLLALWVGRPSRRRGDEREQRPGARGA